jgi:hypothetical protein
MQTRQGPGIRLALFCRDIVRRRISVSAFHDLTETLCGVIAGHSRSENGVASLVSDPAIHRSSKNDGCADQVRE